MKLVQVRPGKTVAVSSSVAEKAARIVAEIGFTPADAQKLAAVELKHSSNGVMLGWSASHKVIGGKTSKPSLLTSAVKAGIKAGSKRESYYSRKTLGGTKAGLKKAY